MKFKSLGQNCLIDSRALIIGPEKISIGDSVRIDSFSVLSSQDGLIEIGNNVHISIGVVVYGAGGVILSSGCGLAAGVKLLSATDDYLWGHLTNPMIPNVLRSQKKAGVILGEHAVVGVNSVLLPGCRLGFGAAVGAMTVVKGAVKDFEIVVGNPMKVVGSRNRELLKSLHEKYLMIRSSRDPN
jgi:galactoside O-acetyltransferase